MRKTTTLKRAEHTHLFDGEKFILKDQSKKPRSATARNKDINFLNKRLGNLPVAGTSSNNSNSQNPTQNHLIKETNLRDQVFGRENSLLTPLGLDITTDNVPTSFGNSNKNTDIEENSTVT